MKNHAIPGERKEKSESLLQNFQDLYTQSETVKMVNLQKLLEAKKTPDKDVARNSSQMVLKSIELQLRILSESYRHDNTGQDLVPREIWDSLLELPGVGPLLRRKKIKEELVIRLREKAKDK